ncbi:MAG: septum site-determining protein MinC [Rhodospirillaceae bacterium]
MATDTENVSERDASFQLRGGSFTLMVLKLVDSASETFFATLADKVRQAPNFFRNAPLVLDLDGLPGNELVDFADLKSRLKEHGLMALAVQGGLHRHQEAALRAGLPLVPSAGRSSKLDTSATPAKPAGRPAAPAPKPAAAEPIARPALVINEPVRSGRQIYAPGGDLVVTAMVSAGAELLADGHIHVYGALRGRALAGLAGDTGARIFCLSLEAEMVSIAGLYRVNEDIPPASFKKPAQIYLKDGYLTVDPFSDRFSGNS